MYKPKIDPDVLVEGGVRDVSVSLRRRRHHEVVHAQAVEQGLPSSRFFFRRAQGKVCGMVWYDMSNMVWQGLWYGTVWYGMVGSGLIWVGLVWFGLVWFDMVERVWYGML